MNDYPSRNELIDSLSYDDKTGNLYWKKNRGTNLVAGSKAGFVNAKGYVKVRFGKRQYLAHRLIWLMIYGELPDQIIDHINRNPGDNRISNLRLVSKSENGQNAGAYASNSSGAKGVSLYKPNGKWRARITIDGVVKCIGYFRTIEEAEKARLLAEVRHHPYSPNVEGCHG